MKPVYVIGVGLWSPGFANAEAFFSGKADPDVTTPSCALVNSRLKRGSSRFANMLGEVVEHAAADAVLDAGKVATVYGSSLGEIETMVTLLSMLYQEEGKLSPNRFKNSVHNAASGLVSIGSSNTAFSTAIAGGTRSFERSLVEAWALLHTDAPTVVLAVGDDAPPPPLDQLDDQGALAVALALSTEPRPGALRLEHLRPGEAAIDEAIPGALRGNCAAAALGLLRAMRERTRGEVSVAPIGQAGLTVDVAPVE